MAVQTTKKPAHKFIDQGIALCIFALLTGCTPPEKTSLENGSQLLKDGKPEKALIELKRAFDFISNNEELKKNPKIMGHLHNQMGFAHQTLFSRDNNKTNHYSLARQAYLFTITNSSTPPVLKQNAHINLAWLYLERYDWRDNLSAFRENAKRAADEFDKLRVSVTDENFNYWFEKGSIESLAGRYTSAKESFKKIGDQDAKALNSLGVLAAKIDGRYEAAIGYFESAIDVDEKKPESYLHLAISRQALGQYQGALDAYKAYLSIVPESIEKKIQVNALVEGLEAYLKPEPKEEPVLEKSEEVTKVEVNPKEEPVEEKPEEVTKVEVNPKEEPLEEKPEEVIASTDQQKFTEVSKEEQGEIVVIEPPMEEEIVEVISSDPKVSLPLPEVKLSDKNLEDKEQSETSNKDAKLEVVLNTDSKESLEDGKSNKKWTDRLNPVRWFDKDSKPEVVLNTDSKESIEAEELKKKWTDRLNPVRWFDGGEKKKANEQLTWKSRTPLPEMPVTKPLAKASTNSVRVASLLPTAVAYPRYTYLHPALPKAGDRQVAKTYLDDGSKAQKSKEWQRAKAAYLEAVKADPAWFEARFKLGQASYYTGETSLALQSFENALSIDPNDGPARFNFAMSLVQGNYFAEAANELETFLQFDPNNIQAHLEVGKLYAEKLRDIEKAAIHYKRAIGLNPEHPEAVNMRYWLIRNKAN
ncbi:MAG: tetratricopeptide repeat protein [Verrucomicrobiota bacterium]|nr:tetratricopeptide repeat protein [Verrucomicrobiota bacterium]